MQLILTHTTQPADILAFTVILLMIHIHRYTCTHQPLPSISTENFFTGQVSNYNWNTYKLLPNINLSHSTKRLHILGLHSA